MKVLVCISKSPDTTSKISFTDNDTKFNEEKVQFIVNPYDEWYSLVRAIELKETQGAHVTVIYVGPATDESVIRKTLAIGANAAVRIDAEAKDGSYVAAQIAAYAQGKDFDIIFTGKETIDYNGSQVAGMIAEELDLPFISLASKLEVEGNTLTLEREVSGGEEVVTVDTPVVISAMKGMAEQRIPNMRGIMAARKTPIEVIAPVEVEALTEVVAYELPVEKTACTYIDASEAEKLIDILHNEAKVI